MKDFLGNDLELNDKVVFVQRGYRNLLRGEIIKITPQMVLISHKRTNVGATETRQLPEQVVKITKEIL